MKHLKMYEGFEETQTIKDIFQDLFDEYDISEYIPDAHDEEEECMLYFFAKDDGDTLILEIFPSFSRIKQDVVKGIDFSGHEQRLESMGYYVSFSWISDQKEFEQSKASWVKIEIDYSEA